MNLRQAGQSRPWLTVGSEVNELLKRVDAGEFTAFTAEFDDINRRWYFSGQGRSGLAAQMAAMRLMHLGREVHFLGEATAPSVRVGDGLVIVSGSGETAVSLGFARIAKSEGVRVLAVTHKPESALAEVADTVLTVPIDQSGQLMGSLFEQAALLLLDSVALGLSLSRPTRHWRCRRSADGESHRERPLRRRRSVRRYGRPHELARRLPDRRRAGPHVLSRRSLHGHHSVDPTGAASDRAR